MGRNSSTILHPQPCIKNSTKTPPKGIPKKETSSQFQLLTVWSIFTFKNQTKPNKETLLQHKAATHLLHHRPPSGHRHHPSSSHNTTTKRFYMISPSPFTTTRASIILLKGIFFFGKSPTSGIKLNANVRKILGNG